jgi:hypothetical protein
LQYKKFLGELRGDCDAVKMGCQSFTSGPVLVAPSCPGKKGGRTGFPDEIPGGLWAWVVASQTMKKGRKKIKKHLDKKRGIWYNGNKTGCGPLSSRKPSTSSISYGTKTVQFSEGGELSPKSNGLWYDVTYRQ